MAKKRQSNNEEAKKRRLSLAQAYKRFFMTDQGKLILHDLMREHFVMSHTFTPQDALAMAYKEGQRNVILRIFSICQIEPEGMEKQITEVEKNAKTTK